MSITVNAAVSGSFGAEFQAANSGFAPLVRRDGLSFGFTFDKATYQEALLGSYTLAAAATQTIDLRAVTGATRDAFTSGKAIALILTATGNTGAVKIEPGAADPLTWFFAGTTPSLTLNCGASGCGLVIADGTPFTVDATHRNLKLTNTGAATVTVRLAALVGT